MPSTFRMVWFLHQVLPYVALCGEGLGVAGCGACAARVGEEVLEIVAFVLGGADAIETWGCEGTQGIRP